MAPAVLVSAAFSSSAQPRSRVARPVSTELVSVSAACCRESGSNSEERSQPCTRREADTQGTGSGGVFI